MSKFPKGASDLNYNTKVIDFAPTVNNIAPGRDGAYALFDGMFYSSTPPNKNPYYMDNGALVIPMGNGLCTQTRDSTAGTLPYLSGATGFYVEFEVHLSDNNPDYWPAVWLMPTEHNLAVPQGDVYPGDPAHYERWMELDIDEGGFTPTTLSSVVDWQGVFDPKNNQYWRDYPVDTVPGNIVTNTVNTPSGIVSPVTYLDRTQPHRFGASFDPVTVSCRFYLDDMLIFKCAAPPIGLKQHFYMIANANTHGQNLNYAMYLHNIRAYTP